MSHSGESQGPAWDLSTEYPSIASAELQSHYDELLSLTDEVAQAAAVFADLPMLLARIAGGESGSLAESLGRAMKRREEAIQLLLNLWAFVNGESAADEKNDLARTWKARIQKSLSRLNQAEMPIELLLKVAPDDFISRLLGQPGMSVYRFSILEGRKTRLAQSTFWLESIDIARNRLASFALMR